MELSVNWRSSPFPLWGMTQQGQFPPSSLTPFFIYFDEEWILGQSHSVPERSGIRRVHSLGAAHFMPLQCDDGSIGGQTESLTAVKHGRYVSSIWKGWNGHTLTYSVTYMLKIYHITWTIQRHVVIHGLCQWWYLLISVHFTVFSALKIVNWYTYGEVPKWLEMKGRSVGFKWCMDEMTRLDPSWNDIFFVELPLDYTRRNSLWYNSLTSGIRQVL